MPEKNDLYQLIRKDLHDLNNVMTVISSTTDLMLYESTLSEAQRNDLQAILQACTSGVQLVDKIRQSVHD